MCRSEKRAQPIGSVEWKLLVQPLATLGGDAQFITLIMPKLDSCGWGSITSKRIVPSLETG
ncbi:hypothetical protein R9C00_14225 [Flammeovirgaceae bacterium SG7u.111]|nr:hypothetical protein [Flammeovirgaceae bacterium SG7u.132]WPO38613.1 hypothetical protein R9C00_14225 [Flammeovirgaceae bacterium SG7u.111]